MRLICLYLYFFSILFAPCFLHADKLQIRHVCGGKTTSLEIFGDYWYQSLGDRLVVLNKQSGAQISTVMLTNSPAVATCTDLLIVEDTLYALLKEKEVVVLDLTNPIVPKVIDRMDFSSSGFIPLGLTKVGPWPVVIGDGGAIRLTDGELLIECEEVITGVALSLGKGVVYAANRRIYDADTGDFLGSATELMELSEDANADIGTLIYTRNLDGQTEIGLMTSDIRDIDINKCKVSLNGDDANITIRGSRLIVSTSMGIYVLGIAPKELRVLRSFDLHGVQDVGVIASNYLAVCGSFGRGMFRINQDSGGSSETLFRSVNASGAMFAGEFDRRGVNVPTESGSAYYSFDGHLDRSETLVNSFGVQTSAVVLGREIVIDSNSGKVATISSDGEKEVSIPSGAITVVPISGNFWFGTEDGIYVFEAGGHGVVSETDFIELSGPIVQLIPLYDGGVCFISESGYVGIVDRVQTSVALEQ